MDARRPWEAVFMAAACDDMYWDSSIKEKALMYMTSLRGRPEITDEGHHAELPAGFGGGGRPGTSSGAGLQQGGGQPRVGKTAAQKRAEKRARQKAAKAEAPPPPQPKPQATTKQSSKGKGKGKPRSQQDCFKFCRDAAGCAEPCPDGRRHPPCPQCGRAHPWLRSCSS